ncbi:MAG: DoxX family protein [Cytophagales bacterium]|nr:DoxX family protein [Cytophagales bacterium]
MTKINTKFSFPDYLINLMVGLVFLSEGIQKWILPNERGVGRFAKIGIPYPEFTGYFVGVTEIVCGLLVLATFKIRYSIIPLLIIIVVAIISSKIIPFPEKGLWETLHASRNDFCMLLGLIYLAYNAFSVKKIA